YATLAAVRERTPIRQVILADVADYFPPMLALAYRVKESIEQRGKPKLDMKALRADPHVHWFKSMVSRPGTSQGIEVFALPEPATPDDLAVLQYTGGTTGVAKGAMLSHRNLVANALQAWSWNEQPIGSKSSSLCVAPFFHVYGLTVGMNMTILNGSTLVLLPRFTVKDTLKAIEKYKPDLFPGVPTLYLALAREVEHHAYDLSSVKVC